LIKACTSNPLLRTFNPKKPIQVETNASNLAIGTCLSQEYDGKWHPIAYYSRKLSPAERNYDIHNKELLAIVTALQHWRVYCEGAPQLTILTDHKNLLYFTTTKELNQQQVCWSKLLGQYKFTIKYTPGKENGRANTLSRQSNYMAENEPVRRNILAINKDGSLSTNYQEFNATLCILDDNTKEFPIKKGKLQIPDNQINDCIWQYHHGPWGGHPRITKTVE
jgi:hypothetical protein